MALHDGDILRTRASGIAGISIVADSLAAIKFGKVRVVRDERGLAVGFEQEGSYVPFGNNDDATDQIAVDITKTFMNYMRQHGRLPRFSTHAVAPHHHVERGVR